MQAGCLAEDTGLAEDSARDLRWAGVTGLTGCWVRIRPEILACWDCGLKGVSWAWQLDSAAGFTWAGRDLG
ncbi:hypothetical protein TIFTF001_037462 [Ficus carica]|uniref:Uncharacterized protein n=1 Tax=Ficus carica TaxID=3494 RepID=A0AA88E5D1_FICCA|nr:hypothetical protein TIFTF001_037462 [Ficus carica]